MSLFPNLDKKQTKKNAYKVLESYRLLKNVAGIDFAPKVTATYSFEPRSVTNVASNAMENHVVRQIVAQQECHEIEKAINRVYDAFKRQILIEKYCKQERSDISLYIDLELTETEFYRDLERAVLLFSEVYKNGILLVFENGKSLADIL